MRWLTSAFLTNSTYSGKQGLNLQRLDYKSITLTLSYGGRQKLIMFMVLLSQQIYYEASTSSFGEC